MSDPSAILEVFFSEKTLKIAATIKQTYRKIIAKEVPELRLANKRLYYNHYTYPFNISFFNEKTTIAHFDPLTYTIAFNFQAIMGLNQTEFENVLRHELAHTIVFLKYGNQIESPHGKEFHQVCQELGWDENVSRARSQVDEKQRAILEKKLKTRHKLLNLSKSSNPHEASLALQKAMEIQKQLPINHLLASGDQELSTKKDDETQNKEIEFARRMVRKTSRSDMINRAVLGIIPFFRIEGYELKTAKQTQLWIYAEAHTLLQNGNLAEEIIAYYESAWSQVKRKSPHIKGLAHKNSFYEGMTAKIIEDLNTYSENSSQIKSEIVLGHKRLQQAAKLLGLRPSRTSRRILSEEVFGLGRSYAKDFSFSKSRKKIDSTLSLPFRN